MLSQTLINTLRQWRLLALLFLLTLLPALPSALAFFSTLTSEFDRSMAPLQMMTGFNYTVFADFMHEHGGAIWPLIRAGWWSALLSLLISVWAKGGILYSFTNGFRAVTFWQSGTHYFRRYLRLLGVTVFFVLLWLLTLILTSVLIGLLDEALGEPFTERGYVAIAMVVGLLFGAALACILCVSQYASVLMYQIDETASLQAYTQSWRFVRRHPRATLGRYLLVLLTGTALLGIYLLLESLFDAHNWLLIGLLFLLQQAFVFSRVVLTVWALRIAQINLGRLPQPVVQPTVKPQPATAPVPAPTDPAGANDTLLPL
ncbi:MAG TPA: hypothetical protein VGA96_07070 [Fibrella sp.]